jgi:predicted thioesterase
MKTKFILIEVTEKEEGQSIHIDIEGLSDIEVIGLLTHYRNVIQEQALGKLRLKTNEKRK